MGRIHAGQMLPRFCETCCLGFLPVTDLHRPAAWRLRSARKCSGNWCISQTPSLCKPTTASGRDAAEAAQSAQANVLPTRVLEPRLGFPRACSAPRLSAQGTAGGSSESRRMGCIGGGTCAPEASELPMGRRGQGDGEKVIQLILK